MVFMTAGLLFACQNDPQSPPSGPEPPVGEALEPGPLAPLDLVYICENRFLAINRTRVAVVVTYRVVGTDEGGSLTLEPASLEDEGFGETELRTRERGQVELSQNGTPVVRRRNSGQSCGESAAAFSVASMAESGSAGQWSAAFPWANVAVHLSLLPTGQVLSWGLSGTPQIWNPTTEQFTSIPSPAVIFCAGHSFLADGRLLVSGGNNDPNVALNGIPDNTIFDPVNQSWSRAPAMRFARWYPTNTTLANGDIVIISGKDAAGATVTQPEVWSSGSLRVLSTAGLSLPLYPRAFLAPNGKVFVAGANQMSRYLNPVGTGSWANVGNRLYGARDYGAAVMYDVGKILYTGGGRTTNTAETIDLNSATPVWKWTGSMAFARRHLNATVLPTGEVLVTGGTSGTDFNDPTRAVHAAEIWDPTTGAWTTLASNAINRVYHSTSILLPDGRVLHTGSGDAGPDQRNAELFSPPYLFKGSRPTITSAPTSVVYGGTFKISTPDAANIAKVSLIRLGSVTHAFNTNQRFQRLSFVHGAGELTVTGPTNANIAPPGHYLLFVLNGEGVPSIGKIVRVGTVADPAPPPNDAPTAAFTQTCTGLTCAFQDGSTDGDGTVAHWHWVFGDGTEATSQNPSHSYEVEGSYQVTLTVTDDDGAQAHVTSTVGVMPPPPNSAPVAGFSQACTGFSCTFTDGSTDADGTVTSWNWNFGDGSASTAQNPEHTYGSEGPYEVTLSIADDDGAPATITHTVTVAPPPPNRAPTADFSETCSGLGCTFTDRSTDSDGNVASWNWDFGDGSSATTQNPAHSYAGAGSYQVTLTVTDNAAAPASASKTISVTAPPPNSAPTAAFSQTCTGLTCAFTDGSTDGDGTVTGWSWNFGDGTAAATRNPTHTFAAGGTFVVTLVAMDNQGATGTTTKSIVVTAPPSNVAPTAAFEVKCNGLKCQFTNRSTDSDGSIVAYRYTFGGGLSAATAPNPSRTYAAGGTYTVSLQVTDDDGATNTRTQAIAVTAAIKLTISGRVDATKQYVTVQWSGARGTTVDLYRFGTLLKQEPNDGLYTESRARPGLSKYTFYVCELGSTTLCSNQATVTF